MDENSSLLKQDDASVYRTYKDSIRSLFRSPIDLWLVLAIKTLGFSGFSVITVAISIYLTEVLDFSDIEMGLIIGFEGFVWGFFSAILGNFPDRYGIRFSLLFSNMAKLITFVGLLFIDERYTQVFLLTMIATAGAAVSVPTSKLAVKRYTNQDARSMGFSVYYIVLFGSVAISGVVTDIVLTYGDQEDMTTYRYTFLFGAIVCSIAIGLTFFVRELEYSDTGEQELVVEKRTTSILEDTRDVLVLKSFWRFFAISMLLVFIRAIYAHISITLPLYMEREISENSHFGYMIALNAVLTLIFTPILTILVYYFSLYTLFVIGGFICSVSPLVLLFSGNYFTVCMFIAIASVGEAIHAPRLLDYVVEIAPPKRLGIFLSISAIPLSASGLAAGFMGGFLLDRYCPEDGETECWKMWGIISLFSSASLLFIFFLRKWIEEPAYESERYISCSNEAKADKHDKGLD